MVGLVSVRKVGGQRGARPFLLWSTLPFVLFFFLLFPGRRYFMQGLIAWAVLAAAGVVALAVKLAEWRTQFAATRMLSGPAARSSSFATQVRLAGARAFFIGLWAPVLVMAVVTVLSNRQPLESSLLSERRIGERLLALAGPGKRVLCFTVTAFYARAERVPLWGPMQGIVRAHGFGWPRDYRDLVRYVREHRVEYVVLDYDLMRDCPDFLERVRPNEFELLFADLPCRGKPCHVFRTRPELLTRLQAD